MKNSSLTLLVFSVGETILIVDAPRGLAAPAAQPGSASAAEQARSTTQSDPRAAIAHLQSCCRKLTCAANKSIRNKRTPPQPA